MLELLNQAEKHVAELLAQDDVSAWKSLHIDYHPPIVDRMWIDWNEYRINLHTIYPCQPSYAFFHPHPWPSAVRIYEGAYMMGIGYGSGIDRPGIHTTLLLESGSSYEMLDRNTWHYVAPLVDTYSITITGRPWNRSMPKEPDKPLHPVSEDTKVKLLSKFRSTFSPIQTLAAPKLQLPQLTAENNDRAMKAGAKFEAFTNKVGNKA